MATRKACGKIWNPVFSKQSIPLNHSDSTTTITSLPSITQHVPWIAVVLRSLPFFGSGMQALTRFGVFHAKRRAALELKKKDLFYYLVRRTLC
jgi:hypothetical protein